MSDNTLSPPAGFSIARRDITLEGARYLIAQAQAKAATLGISISVAVVDRHGELIAFERHDNASLVTTQVAYAKARSAALLRAPSKMIEDFINGGEPSFLSIPGVTPLQGGVPLIISQEVVGAIGISGGTGDQDSEVATLSANSLRFN